MADPARLLGTSVSTFYDGAVHFVKGSAVWLLGVEGRKYLGCYYNVPHVGHCNIRVVEAITQQADMLNIPTRCLHDDILEAGHTALYT